MAVMVLAVLSFMAYAGTVVHAHEAEGGKEPVWVLSGYVPGSIDLSPNESLDQWKGARMVDVGGWDGVGMDVMSVHNGTYAAFLIKRPFNVSINYAYVIVAFEGVGKNGDGDVWVWRGGQLGQITDAGVKAEYALANGELTVVFGRQLEAAKNGTANFEVGVPYDDFIKTTSLSTLSANRSVELESLDRMGLEFLPQTDAYPKLPIAFSVVIVAAAAGLIYMEIQKHK